MPFSDRLAIHYLFCSGSLLLEQMEFCVKHIYIFGRSWTLSCECMSYKVIKSWIDSVYFVIQTTACNHEAVHEKIAKLF